MSDHLRRPAIEPLESRRLMAGTGLTAQYYDNSDFTNLKLTRTDATVNYFWGDGSPATTVGTETFSARWTGKIEATSSGTHTFHTLSDERARLWVNGKLVIDDWVNHAARERAGTIWLTAGTKYDIRMEFVENTGLSAAKLLWTRPGQTKQIVPTANLYPMAVSAPAPTPAPNPIGRTITVDPAGAIKTISAGYAQAVAGDLVLVKPGTYRESLNLTRSGAAGKPITIQAQTYGTAIIDAAGKTNAITGTAQHIVFKGFVVRNTVNGLFTHKAAVRVGSNWRVEDMKVERNQGTGLVVMGSNVTLLRVTAQDNGQAGIAGNSANTVLLKDCVTRGNNKGLLAPAWAGQANTVKRPDGKWYVHPDWEAGGGKWWDSGNITIDGMQAYDNGGPGIWFDYESTNVIIRNSTVRDAGGWDVWHKTGIRLELQDQGPYLVENNKLSNNAGGNINLAQTRNVTIRNNTFVNGDVLFRDYYRGAQYTIQNITITGNRFKNSKVDTWEGTWNGTTDTAKSIKIDGNTYDNGGGPLMRWGTTNYTSLASIRSAIGFELTGVIGTVTV